MRRGLASLIIGLSLVVASLSWAGFILSRTVLDPGRSERLAAQLLEHDGVREALAEWERDLRPHGIEYQVVDTDQPMALALRAYLRKRERLG